MKTGRNLHRYCIFPQITPIQLKNEGLMRDQNRCLEFITPPPSYLNVVDRKLSFDNRLRQRMTESGTFGSRPIRTLQRRLLSRLKKHLPPLRSAAKSPPSPNKRRQEAPKACKFALSAQAIRWMH